MFELIALLATESSKLSKKDAFTAITGLVDKMSDIKLKGSAGQALTAMSEALGPQFVFTQLHKRAAAQKNPKVSTSNCGLAALRLPVLGTLQFTPKYSSVLLVSPTCCVEVLVYLVPSRPQCMY